MTRIDGYNELFGLRMRKFRPEAVVLITDSEVIEHQWREITHTGGLWDMQAAVPPCSVLRIRNEKPHNLIAIRDLPVLALLTRQASLPWLEMIRLAKPSELVEQCGPHAYAVARLATQNFIEALLEEPA
jgi:hypothetical protein